MVLSVLSVTTMTATANSPIQSIGTIDYMDKDDNSKVVRFYSSDLRYLNDEVEKLIVTVTDGKGKIADAIKAKDATATVTASSSFEELGSAIKNIGGAGTAGVGDVLAGKTIYTADGYKEGKMPNWSGQQVNLEENRLSVSNGIGTITIPELGYYDTTSKLTFNASKLVNL